MSTWGKRKLKTLLVEMKISVATVEIGAEVFFQKWKLWLPLGAVLEIAVAMFKDAPVSKQQRSPHSCVVGALLTTVRHRIIIWLYHGGKDEKCGLDTMKFYSAIQNHVIYRKMDILKIIPLSNISRSEKHK